MARESWISSRFIQTTLRLPPPVTRRVTRERAIPITVSDGVVLRADHWAPAEIGDRLPVMLMRTPYTRESFFGAIARGYAERGFQTLMVSSRGTFGSGGGEFHAMHHEHADGLAVIDWIREQPWYRGQIVLVGPSYLGYTQWAVAADAPPEVIAMAPQITSARLAQNFLTSGTAELDTALRWSHQTFTQEDRWANVRGVLRRDERQLQRAMHSVPLNRADQRLLGRRWDFYQDVSAYPIDDQFWEPWDFSSDVSRVRIPASFMSGWQDIFLIDSIRDYTTLRDAGTKTRITIGPWVHASVEGMGYAMRDAIEWGTAESGGKPAAPRGNVRLYINGSKRWKDFSSWPPEGFAPVRWYLRVGGALTLDAPGVPGVRGAPGVPGAADAADAAGAPGVPAAADARRVADARSVPGAPVLADTPSRFRYDPKRPTPSVGGRLLGIGAGVFNNDKLEARDDVLTFTSERLPADLDVVGEISAEVWMTSSRPSWDIFVRLCDVDERGHSFNVTDALLRVTVPGFSGGSGVSGDSAVSGGSGVSGGSAVSGDSAVSGSSAVAGEGTEGEAHASAPGEPQLITLTLAPTAQTFRRGHRLRVQVSSGAHPRYGRNLGDGTPFATATHPYVADQTVFHDAEHPSSISLPQPTPR